LALTSLVGMMNGFAIGPLLPNMSRDLDISVPVLGQVATFTYFMTAIGGVLVGPLADHYGQRRTIIFGLLITLVSALGTALAVGFGSMLVARLIGGVGGSISSGVTLGAAGSRFTGDARRRALSLITATIAAGVVVAAPLLTTVAAVSSWRYAFGFVAALALIALALFVLGVRDPQAGAAGAAPSLQAVREAYMPLLRDRTMVALFSASTLQAIAWVGPFTYLGALLADRYGFSTQAVGLAYVAVGGGFFTGSLLGGGRLGGAPPRVLYAASTLLVTLLWALLLILTIGSVQTIVALACLTVVGGVGRVCLTTILASESPAGPATTMVLNSSMMTLGAALGSLIGGVLISFGGYSALGLGLPLFGFLAAALIWQPRPPAAMAPVGCGKAPTS
jgi:DHA1 family inner membrane transport protein